MDFRPSFGWWAVDPALSVLALYLAGVARGSLPFGVALPDAHAFTTPAIYLFVLVIWPIVFRSLSMYRQTGLFAGVVDYGRVVVAVTAATIILAASLYLSYRDAPRLLVGYFFVLDLAFLLGARVVATAVGQGLGFRSSPRRYVVIGLGEAARQVVEVIRGSGGAGLDLVGLVVPDSDGRADHAALARDLACQDLGNVDRIAQIVREQAIDGAIIALPFHERRRLINLVSDLQQLRVQVSVVPDMLDLALHGQVQDLGGVPLLAVEQYAISGLDRLIKRSFDIVVASLVVLALSPVMLAIALAIRLDSPGAIIFKQMRVGERGRLFPMLKFRSMVDGADARSAAVQKTTSDGKPLHKVPDDPRVTRVGRFIRRTSLDELPQLFNVIVGQMSLVGPRPEMPYIVQYYEPWQWARFAVPQGITGWWQVSGRSERLMHLHTEDDLYYISNYSFWLDVRILWRTAGVVLQGRGAY